MSIKVVLLSAQYCAPCALFKEKHWPELKKAHPNVQFVVRDIDADPDPTITAIPLIRVMKGNKVVKTFRRVFDQLDDLHAALADAEEKTPAKPAPSRKKSSK